MKIALVRHGQTEENFYCRIQGRRNIMLNDTGRRQCQKLKMKIKDHHYDVCYISPMVRTVETAMILIGDCVPTVLDDRLIEREMGELEGRPCAEYDGSLFWDYDSNRSDYGVEPIRDVFVRCKNFLDEILEQQSNKNILVVTHGAPYRALRYLISKQELKGKLSNSSIENCQFEEFEI